MDHNQEITPEITSLLDSACEGEFVDQDKQPQILRDAIKDGENEYHKLALTLPSFSQDLMFAFWQERIKEGMIIEKPRKNLEFTLDNFEQEI